MLNDIKNKNFMSKANQYVEKTVTIDACPYTLLEHNQWIIFLSWPHHVQVSGPDWVHGLEQRQAVTSAAHDIATAKQLELFHAN